jgi:hypothetical protein
MNQTIPPYEHLEIGVRNQDLPQFIFKYRTIDSTKKLLENNSLWFSSPKDFNDPFDCQIIPDTNNTVEQIEQYIRKNTPGTFTDKEIVAHAAKFQNENIWQDYMKIAADRCINSTGVCCFSKNKKNLLMWSHYADSHTGVCLKFDILKDADFFHVILPVIYRQDYPVYNHLENSESFTTSMFLSKSTGWEYEEELRILKLNKNGL